LTISQPLQRREGSIQRENSCVMTN
jgi:hypothetical protein